MFYYLFFKISRFVSDLRSKLQESLDKATADYKRAIDEVPSSIDKIQKLEDKVKDLTKEIKGYFNTPLYVYGLIYKYLVYLLDESNTYCFNY